MRVTRHGLVGECGLHSRKLTWKPQKGPIKTTFLLKGDYMGFHVSLGECSGLGVEGGGGLVEPRLRHRINTLNPKALQIQTCFSSPSYGLAVKQWVLPQLRDSCSK